MTTLIILNKLKSILNFIITNWQYVAIFILTIMVLNLNNTVNNKDSEITKIKSDHEITLLQNEVVYKNKVIEVKNELIKVNERVEGVISDYHEAIKEQDARTVNHYKEVQTLIPSAIRESCDYGNLWMRKQNDYIRSSNNTNPDNSK